MTTVGLDFGTTSIKLVKVQKESPLKVVAAATIAMKPELFLSEDRKNQEELASITKKLFSDAKVSDKEVNVALPESQMFTRIIELPALSDEELSTALKWQAEQYVPLPLTEVNMDFTVIHRPSDPREKMQVLLVAAPIRVVNSFVSLLEHAGLSARSLETELIAASRAFFPTTGTPSTTMIVDCGAQNTNMAIVKDTNIVFTHTITFGGDAITRSINDNFNIPIPQAEEYKKAYGMDQSQLQGKVYQAIKPIIDGIVSEIKKSCVYFSEKKGTAVERIIIFGGTSLMPGLVSYLGQMLEVEVQVGNPWESFAVNQTMSTTRSSASGYTVATGLAIRDLV